MNGNKLKEIMEKADLVMKSAIEEVKLYEIMNRIALETAREIFEAKDRIAIEKFEGEHPIVSKAEFSLVQVIGEMELAIGKHNICNCCMGDRVVMWKEKLKNYYYSFQKPNGNSQPEGNG